MRPAHPANSSFLSAVPVTKVTKVLFGTLVTGTTDRGQYFHQLIAYERVHTLLTNTYAFGCRISGLHGSMGVLNCLKSPFVTLGTDTPERGQNLASLQEVLHGHS